MVFVLLLSNHIVIITHSPAEKLVSLVCARYSRVAWVRIIRLCCSVITVTTVSVFCANQCKVSLKTESVSFPFFFNNNLWF